MQQPYFRTFAARLASNQAGNSTELPMLAMFCVAFRRQILNSVGLLDEQFELGMFEEFWRRKGQSEEKSFRDGFAQVDMAEKTGLDVCWLAELHVNPNRSVLAAPLNIASAVAARTTRMKIVIAVQVLPLCHPIRIAEELAMLDTMANHAAKVRRIIDKVGETETERWIDTCLSLENLVDPYHFMHTHKGFVKLQFKYGDTTGDGMVQVSFTLPVVSPSAVT